MVINELISNKEIAVELQKTIIRKFETIFGVQMQQICN